MLNLLTKQSTTMYYAKPYDVFYLLLLLSAFSCSNQKEGISSYWVGDISEKTMDEYLTNKMKELNMAGMSFAFINEGEMTYHKTFGYASLEEKKPVTNQTIFEAASMSKSVFAYFVMKYVEEGKLDLDKPLYEYLPYPDIAYDERYKKITARMVLSHRSGFPNWRSDHKGNKLFIKFEPGTDYCYSGEGYQYLAMVLKHIEQTDWAGLETQFQTKVAKPFGMEHTTFLLNEYGIAHKAEGYDEEGKWIGLGPNPDSLFQYQFRAPASIHTEAGDFSKWMIALMNREGLTENSFAELWKPHSYVGNFDGFDVDYTLGFFTPQLPFTNLFLHGGNNYGYTAYFALDPDKKWGFVLLTNSEYGEQLGNQLILYLLFEANQTKLLLLVGTVVLLLIVGIVVLIRRIRRTLRK